MPHGERSMTPVKLAGLSQLDSPVDMVTALRRSLPAACGGPDSCEIVTPARLGSTGCATGYCSRVASVSISP